MAQPRLALAAAAAAAAFLPRVAAADEIAAASSPPPAAAGPRDPYDIGRLDLAMGLLAGGYSVGPVRGPAVGFHLDGGWSAGAAMLYGEYDFVRVGQSSTDVDMPVRGTEQRIAAMGRYAFSTFGGGDFPLQGRLWAEVGAGRELVAWDGGGRLHRDDVALGVGAEMNVGLHRDRSHPQVIGLFYAFRMTIAKAPADEKISMATCEGPCDEATSPPPWDLGIFFNTGLSWGR